MRYLYESYQFGIDIRNDLYTTDIVTAFERLDRLIDTINDGYPAWHPRPSTRIWVIPRNCELFDQQSRLDDTPLTNLVEDGLP